MHHRKRRARDSHDPRGGHRKPVKRGQHFGPSPFSSAPVEESGQHHQEKRLRVSGHQEESGRMRQNRQGTEPLQRTAQPPSRTKQKEIGPETPGGQLSRE